MIFKQLKILLLVAILYLFPVLLYGQLWLSDSLKSQLSEFNNSDNNKVHYLLYNCGMVKVCNPTLDTLSYEILRYIHNGVKFEPSVLKDLYFVNSININLSTVKPQGRPTVERCSNIDLKKQLQQSLQQYLADYPKVALFDSIVIIGKTSYDYYHHILCELYDNGITISDISLLDQRPDLLPVINSFIRGRDEYFEALKKMKYVPEIQEEYPEKIDVELVIPKKFQAISVGANKYLRAQKREDKYYFQYKPRFISTIAFFGLYLSNTETEIILAVQRNMHKTNITLESFPIKNNQVQEVIVSLPRLN
jgi:hypothetical protein